LLFLLNDVVLTIDPQATMMPVEAARFRALSMSFVIELGQELFAEHPRLPHTHPEKARRLAMLLMSKDAELNAALFVAPSEGCEPSEVAVRFCGLSFDVMAALNARQNEGKLNAVAADREVWRRMAA
jgi:hypothetical protein